MTEKTIGRRLSPQERYERLQDAWRALNQIDGHLHQEGYEIDLDEKRTEASQAVGEVIEHYRRHEGADTDHDST